MDQRTLRMLAGAGFLIVWVVTLFLPVAVSGDSANGFIVLVMGWLGLLMFQFGWLGNLFFWFVLPVTALVERPPVWVTRIAAGLLLACALDALLWTNIPTDANDGPITSYGPGYWLWISCMVALAGWAFARSSRSMRAREAVASNVA